MNLPRLALLAATTCVSCAALTSNVGQPPIAQTRLGGDNCVIDIRPLDDEQIEALVAYSLEDGTGNQEVLTLTVTPTKDSGGAYHKLKIADENGTPLHVDYVPDGGAKVVLVVKPTTSVFIRDKVDATLYDVTSPEKPSFTMRGYYDKVRFLVASPVERHFDVNKSRLDFDIHGLGFSLTLLH